MKKVSSLHEEFISSARKAISFEKLPISPTEVEIPIVVVNKWIKKNNSLEKKFDFLDKVQRNKFINLLFNYEEDVGHHATFLVKGNSVVLTVQTHNIESITELDKEYARFADDAFKDTIYVINKFSYTF